jgi:hypothetical protein
MTKSNLLLGIVIFDLLAGGWLNTAPAQVFDEAKFFSRDVALQADKQLRQLGKIQGLTLVIETFMQPSADVAELIREHRQTSRGFCTLGRTTSRHTARSPLHPPVSQTWTCGNRSA